MLKTVSIGSASAGPGVRTNGHLYIGDHADGSPVNVPVIIINGSKPGPRLWIHAAAHADENIGTVVLLKSLRDLDPKEMRGTVIAIPALNVAAYQRRERYSSKDFLNLGGSIWPGDPNGRYSERLAHVAFQEICTNADYVISLHGGMPGLMMVCNWAVSTFDPETKTGKMAKEFMEAFGYKYLCTIMSREPKGFTPVGGGGLFNLLNYQKNIPGFIAEVAHQDEKYVSEAIQGITNELIYLKIIDGTPVLPKEYLRFAEYIKVFPKHGGVWDLKVRPGDTVSKGQLLATVSSIFGEERERVTSPIDGAILSAWTNPTVSMDEGSCFEIGRPLE